MIRVNFVISRDMSSKIFSDIFQRFMDSGKINLQISEKAIEESDIYHYHRPQLEQELLRPSVVTVHHDLDDPDPFVRFERFARIYQQADKIICLNSKQKSALNQEGYSQTTIIPHGHDSKIFYKKNLSSYSYKNKIRLGFFSKRYDRRFKGEVYLYELMDQIDPNRFSFLFIGEGRSIDHHHARSLGFESQCFEYLPYKLYIEAYKSIDFLLMVSTFEGGPANLPEAIASGTPILGTNVGMAHDLIIPQRNGVILTGKILEDIHIFNQLSNNTNDLYDQLMVGAHHTNTSISWDQVIDAHVTVYQTLQKL